MKKQLLLVSFFVLVLILNSYALPAEYKIQTKQQAYDVAIKVTGFDKEIFIFDSLVNSFITKGDDGRRCLSRGYWTLQIYMHV